MRITEYSCFRTEFIQCCKSEFYRICKNDRQFLPPPNITWSGDHGRYPGTSVDLQETNLHCPLTTFPRKCLFLLEPILVTPALSFSTCSVNSLMELREGGERIRIFLELVLLFSWNSGFLFLLAKGRKKGVEEFSYLSNCIRYFFRFSNLI